jgi:hypothetical protein
MHESMKIKYSNITLISICYILLLLITKRPDVSHKLLSSVADTRHVWMVPFIDQATSWTVRQLNPGK